MCILEKSKKPMGIGVGTQHLIPMAWHPRLTLVSELVRERITIKFAFEDLSKKIIEN